MDSFIETENLRFDSYRLLSACFCQPQKDVFPEEDLLKNLTFSLRRTCPEAVAFSSKMEESILKCGNEELAIEYAKLFVGPFELKAPPYGSVYLDGARRVMGDSTMEVIKMYEAEGLRKDENFHDLPDHIAVELEFMSFLIYKEIDAVKKADFNSAVRFIEKQERFLQHFLGRWIDSLCKKIKDGTDNGFYAALADCVSTFMRRDRPCDIRELAGEKSFSGS